MMILLSLLSVTGPAGAATSNQTPYAGVLNPTPASARQLAAAGVNAVNLQLGWDAAQPTGAGILNPYYLAEVRSAYQAYRSAGLQVILDPGLQYTPAWVLDLPDSRFVNQYGQAFTNSTASGEGVADAVWNGRVRAAQAQYLSQLGAALGRDAFAAVRVGGLLTGELRLPGAGYGGHTDNWWAFSAGARAVNPVPSYRPGTANPAAAAKFLGFYLGSLADYQDFLVTQTRASFNGDLLLMYPSYGVRPGDVVAATAAGLAPSTVRFTELQQGLDFARMVAKVPGYRTAGLERGGRVIVYSTWLDGPEFGSAATDLSPIGYLATLARKVSAPVAGENTESSATDVAALSLSQSRARSLGLVGIMWFNRAGDTAMAAKVATSFASTAATTATATAKKTRKR